MRDERGVDLGRDSIGPGEFKHGLCDGVGETDRGIGPHATPVVEPSKKPR